MPAMSASAASGHAPSAGEHQQSSRPFGSAWDWPQAGAWSGLLVLLRGPAPPRGWPVGPYFPDSWLRSRTNWQMFCLSALSHCLLFLLPISVGMIALYRPSPPSPPRAEVSWMGGSSQVLLPYIPALRRDSRKDSSRAGEEPAKRGADAFHPRQTIISKPLVATHPRQTLIEPAAAPEAPKILPPMPDIVQWPNLPKPLPPRRHLRANPAARMQQQLARQHPRAVAPEVHSALPEMTFTSEHPDLAKPSLEVNAGARPTFAAEKKADDVAPDISAPGADLTGQKLIALSEAPAPPPPDLQVPAGNLSAQFVKSPEADSPGGAGAAPAGSGLASTAKRTGSAHGAGVPGVAIVGPRRGPVANIAGPAGRGGLGPGSALGSQPHTLGATPQPGTPATPGELRPNEPSIQDRIKAVNNPEDLLEPGRIYTLHVNMPNLASVTGTWTLKFVELDENGKEIPGTIDAPNVAGPVPLRKVEPKYPPAYVSARVQGDVILYAIIRRDGSVDSIEVVRSLDPLLDQNAMQALSRWKFQAAQRDGRAVELAAIV